uniref:Uncharacterized protein n=1 Tax=Candidatus Kentrum sp. SD TaxID=2126332 RepID=A0A450YYU3_9GAMM|nr:MAG: hypothetical protein BECKSD772F_GA0070984_10812 [Candidatus Kentron sp. SD]VFK46705.1 MAG: hypothetical protein BECKSD772E_GA0070983_10792 [Candidatus Kentron sp. SD]VFK80452.1 MAG: hypothetical protein BECKSD772D_GA0070982_11165 [Candidatus Kentron sp. SD]
MHFSLGCGNNPSGIALSFLYLSSLQSESFGGNSLVATKGLPRQSSGWFLALEALEKTGTSGKAAHIKNTMGLSTHG